MTAPDENGDLALLEAALRDDTPRPDPAFARELDRLVADGFPRERRFRLSFLPPRRVLALASAAAVLVIGVVAALGVFGGSDTTVTSGGNVAKTSTEARGDTLLAAPEPGGQVTGSAGRPMDLARTSPGRRVERSAQMTIAAAAEDLGNVADRVGQVAQAHRGYVVSSHMATGEDSTRGGEFVLRVPTSELEPALGELGKLGDVRARSETSQDMTAPYRHTQDRLADLLLERSATVDRLKQATGDEALRLRARLRELSAAIDDMTGQMHRLRRQTVFSTVNVTLEQRRGSGAAAPGDGPGGAWHDALDLLSGALGIAIRALGVIVPLALLGLLGWLGAGLLRRRRREAALF